MGDSDKDLPWGKIVIGAGITIGVGGAAYLLYKQLSGSSEGNHKSDLSKEKASTQMNGVKVDSSGKKHLDQSTTLKEEGNKLFKAGKYSEAVEKYTQALAFLPDSNVQSSSVLHQNRAAAHEKMGNTEKVVEDCTKAIEKNKTYTKAYIRRGRANETLGRLAPALVDLTTGSVLEQFQNPITLEDADRVLKARSEELAKIEVQKRKEEGYITPLSLSFVESYFDSFCQDPILTPEEAGGDASTLSEGVEEIRQSILSCDYVKTMEICDRIIENGEKDLAEAFLIKATFAVIRGNSEQATKDFEDFFTQVEKLPDNGQTRRLRANALIKRGSFKLQLENKEGCFEDFKEAENIDTQNPDVYHHRGQLKILMNLIPEAKEDFAKCTSLNPNFAIGRVQACFADFRFAMTTNSSLEVNKSINRFEDVVFKDFPNCPEGYALLGQVYSEKSDFADAEQMFDKAIELLPNNANFHVHKGLLELQKTENLERAKAMIEKGLKVDANCEFAYETLGTLDVQRGELKTALEYFDKALKLARTEMELAHLFSLKEAGIAQIKVMETLNMRLPMAPL